MRALFIPSDYGGGLGHVSRCVALAEEFRRQGDECVFIITENHRRLLEDLGFKAYTIPDSKLRNLFLPFSKSRIVQVNGRTDKPVYVEFSSIDYQVTRDGYLDEFASLRRFKSGLKLIEALRPDVLIGDIHLLALPWGRNLRLKVVQITRFMGFPPRPNMIWWKPAPVQTPPDVRQVFAPICQLANMPEIQKAADMLKGDVYLIPSSQEFEPIPTDLLENTFFAGPLLCSWKKQSALSSFRSETGKRRIFISIGGGARGVGHLELFRLLVEALKGLPVEVLISTSGKFPASNLSQLPSNFQIADWVDGHKAQRWCDLAIYHGGYATTHELLVKGRPGFVLPFHTEQEGNGRRLEQLKIGAVLPICKEPLETVSYQWRYGQYSFSAGYEIALTSHDIRNKVAALLEDSDLKGRLKTFAESLLAQGGTQKAVQIIRDTI